MTILWYIGFTILLSMPIAIPLSGILGVHDFRGKLMMLGIGAIIIIHLLGVIVHFVGPIETYTFTMPW